MPRPHSRALLRPLDHELVATQLLRALRGSRRSRPGFSRLLGYRSNIAQRWETGLCWPTAMDFFRICAHLKLPVAARIARFLRREPAWLANTSLESPSGIGALLSELRGRTPIGALAARAGFNRYSVSRWLQGTATPRLPELLALVEACSGRMLDFVAAFVDPGTLPALSARWRMLTLNRELAYTHPSTQAVLRALELDSARSAARPAGDALAHLAREVGMTAEEVREALNLLETSGQIQKTRHGYVAGPAAVVDTGAEPQRARALKLKWASVALARLESGRPGHCGYSLFTVSREDLHRLRELQLAFVREMQSVIAASKRNECVGLYCAQLLHLAVPEQNEFRRREPATVSEAPSRSTSPRPAPAGPRPSARRAADR